ncbi:aldose 1-epimerase [Catalinimonas alkaloidigena]|uniref:aldose epimerase family protein n=1 Tax=Catalinimonas alkaloidigena TaxID=1075417 RepID=UPI002406CB96|nr:aldose epimerase family protein [Catalinimonas alkaloidigena]MDF9801189.1 aldose 1-epimerase [Catalinimonas alkaloidigena]
MKPYLLIFGLFVAACQSPSQQENEQPTMQEATNPIPKESFGTGPDGEAVDIYTLTNQDGMEAKITNYGGIVTSLKVKDAQGNFDDVVLGFDNLKDYVDNNPFFGALVGRYGNRIAKGKFTIDGTTYQLDTNNMGNHLHGGLKGFDKVVWSAEPQQSEEGQQLVLTYTSPDGDQGYPGTLETRVTYTLTDENVLRVDYEATTDKKTIVNLTNHSYFNLTGDPTQTVLNHEIMINADQFVPVDKTLIPTGELNSVEGTPFNFTELKPIGQQINEDSNEQIKYGMGYDHCWVLDKEGMGLAARVHEPSTGRVMEVYTTEPGVQFYTGNFLNGSVTGKEGVAYAKRTAFCLETEHFPDSPNQPDFPSVELAPGETYSTTTEYRFSTE